MWMPAFLLLLFYHPPTHSFFMQCYRCEWLVIIHTIAIKITLKWMWNICFCRYGNKEIRFVSSSLPAGVQCEKGYTPPPPGIASLSRRCYMASSLPPQTASWCCLSSWRELACRETSLSTSPLHSLTSQAHLLMDQQDSWDGLIRLI